MSIIYKPRKMVSTVPGKEKTGYFAGKVSGGTVNTEELCYCISDKCSITGSDVKAVIEALIKEIEIQLLAGRSIRLDELGIFSASITSDVVSTEDQLKPKKVRIKTVTFLPSVRIKKIMNKAKFIRLRDFNRMAYGIDKE